MAHYDDPLPKSTTDAMFDTWVSCVRRKECASILSLPRFDRQYRVAQFLQTVAPRHPFQCFALTLQSLVTEMPDEVIERLESIQEKKKQTVFFILDAEWLLTAAPSVIPRIQKYLHDTNRSVSFLFFFEKDLLSTTYQSLIVSCPSFIQNIFYQPLYKADDIDHFLCHMASLYGYTITKEHRKNIVRECGGYIWLSTEAIRHLHDTDHLSFDHEAIEYRLGAIWEGLCFDEQQVLRKIIFRQPLEPTEMSGKTYFERTGLIINNQCTVPIIRAYVEKLCKHDFVLKVIDHKYLFVGPVSVTNRFSKREKNLLIYFLEHKNEVVMRDDVASILWDGEAAVDYTDWTLDQVINRLRKKIHSLHLLSDCIKTRKGKGFEYTE